MKIGCNTVDFRKYPFEKALQWIAEAGYEYVEVEANMAWRDHADPYRDDPIKFKATIDKFGFKGLSGLGSHRELITDDQGAKDLEHAIPWSKAAGIPVVLTGEGRLPEGMSEEEALKTLKERLERLAKVAEKNQVYLAMEPHGSISLKPGGLPKILSQAFEVDVVKVLDLCGLVKRFARSPEREPSPRTRADVVAGTPAYMAPEIALGGEDIDGRADLYGLGCVAYWLLTGQLLFDTDSPVAAIAAHIERRPDPPRRRTELPVPPDLDRIVVELPREGPGGPTVKRGGPGRASRRTPLRA